MQALTAGASARSARPALVTGAEAAAHLGLSRRTFYRYRAEGRLSGPAHRKGRVVLFDLIALSRQFGRLVTGPAPSATSPPRLARSALEEQLGEYVRIRERAGGSHRITFEVPEDERPEGWPPSLELPGDRRFEVHDLRKMRFFRAVQAAAARHLKNLTLRRSQERVARTHGQTVAGAIEALRVHPKVRGWTPKYRERVFYYCEFAHEWSLTLGGKQFQEIETADWELFLDGFAGEVRVGMQNACRWLGKAAIRAKWIKGNPMNGIDWNRPDRSESVETWEESQVWEYACAAWIGEWDRDANPGLAALIYFAWRHGQRLEDLVELQHGQDGYSEGVFAFHRLKNNKEAVICLSENEQNLIEACRHPSSKHVFANFASDQPFTVSTLGYQFRKLRLAMAGPDRDETHLVLKQLRHTCVGRLLDAGFTAEQIAAVTGHSPLYCSVLRKRYIVRSSNTARNVLEQEVSQRGGSDRAYANTRHLKLKRMIKSRRRVDTTLIRLLDRQRAAESKGDAEDKQRWARIADGEMRRHEREKEDALQRAMESVPFILRQPGNFAADPPSKQLEEKLQRDRKAAAAG